MAVISRAPVNNNISDDPLSPWLRSIETALTDLESANNPGTHFIELLSHCVETFMKDPCYQDDVRFLRICFIYIDYGPDFESIFNKMEQNKICFRNSLRYEAYALFLEAKGMLVEAQSVYQLGISRNAEPLERLKKAHALFIERLSDIVNACSPHKMDGESCINPWFIATVKDLLRKMNAQISRYEGYHSSTKGYSGKVALSSLQKSARNKVIEIGGKKYQIKGCAGVGGFAQVFKAYVNSDPDDVVALKIQKPPVPWEFYLYRQLDVRIPEKERLSFGFAHRLHLYSDYSILVSDFLADGTLQDAINSYVFTGGSMEEVLCIYYTIEMLSMLETIHRIGIIHGDFKPDNLLIRYARSDLIEDGFRDRSGPWRDQGLCLVDWGRGIDRSLFPENIRFTGDCRTSGFHCVEMQENRPWTYQVDTYGLCVIVHMMLHNTYMEIEKQPCKESYIYQPKLPYKRYWKVDLWKNLFRTLLNHSPCDDHIKELTNLRQSFQDYMCSNPEQIRKLKQLFMKQRTSFCSSCNYTWPIKPKNEGEHTRAFATRATQMESTQVNLPPPTQSIQGEHTRAFATQGSQMDLQFNPPFPTQSTQQSAFPTQSSQSSFRSLPRGSPIKRGDKIVRVRSENEQVTAARNVQERAAGNEQVSAVATEQVSAVATETQSIKRIKIEKGQQIRKSERNKMNIWKRKCKETNGITIVID